MGDFGFSSPCLTSPINKIGNFAYLRIAVVVFCTEILRLTSLYVNALRDCISHRAVWNAIPQLA